MANIRLKELIEANVDPKLVARSKESGKLVYFKTPQAKDAAVKAGSHLEPKGKKGGEPKADAKPNNMFGKDYSKDRGGDTKIQAFKSADGSDVGPNKYTTAISKIRPSDSSMKIKSEPTPKIVGNWKPDEDGKMSFDAADDVRNYLNDVLGVDGMAEVDYNSGNIQYGLSDGENSIFVGNEDGTYNVSFEGPSMDIDKINQSYKSFKNPKDALTYAGELAKANREGLEQKQESTKLTSMIKR